MGRTFSKEGILKAQAWEGMTKGRLEWKGGAHRGRGQTQRSEQVTDRSGLDHRLRGLEFVPRGPRALERLQQPGNQLGWGLGAGPASSAILFSSVLFIITNFPLLGNPRRQGVLQDQTLYPSDGS